MFKLSASLGLKYFRSSKGAFVSFTSIMAVIGLTIGVAALIIVTSVMNGFEKELRDRILGVIPHVLIHSKEPISNYELLIDQIEKNPDGMEKFKDMLQKLKIPRRSVLNAMKLRG